ncbi:MAG TPA: phosphoribosylanthranilate isomerase [Pyrinomonadaceae bacterium]|nr:phosphoribosylanthranilate isomerase [Chloracidobacterium sp.]HBE83190.1 phosphoribosylanthranilate isomerase [Blastocatellia bacterium]HRJ89275.1 phosphoribosylanthranilate isomerase [Pyrinomonadaceae bacterium]HRK51632.1 phosphoribosylanthranilate isomerase [Pyrinomonadaceae bacterium]
MVKVKICGITNLGDAATAARLGADMLGFNFCEKSPRFITPNAARDIIRELTASTLNIGVFVDESEDTVVKIAETTGLSGIQLHGNESPDLVSKLRARTKLFVIKALRVGPDFLPETAAEFETDAILLDAYSPSVYGGTGEMFDWKVAKTVKYRTKRLFLAGGLKPGNVADAVSLLRPFAVDVASGVESSPGIKDPKRVESFIRIAKQA